MFRPLYVGHLQVEIQLTDQLYKMWGHLVGGEQDLFVSIVGTITQGY
jgi:hypothetical protein